MGLVALWASGPPDLRTNNSKRKERSEVASNRVRMNIPSPSPAVLREPRGVDGNIHTNWLG